MDVYRSGSYILINTYGYLIIGLQDPSPGSPLDEVEHAWAVVAGTEKWR